MLTRISLSIVLLTTFAGPARSDDWAAWRGATQSSVSVETGLVDDFDPKGGDGSNVLWKNEAAGGISTPIVMNGRVFTIVRDQSGTNKDAEKVIALDAITGKQLWQNVYNVFLSDLPAERIGWSNVCGDPGTNRVYVLGACCLFQCIDGETGKTIWARSLSEEFGMLSTYGGRTNTPIVYEDLVIISGVTTGWDETAKPCHRFLAFDKTDGKLLWITGTRPLPEDTTYSTPVVRKIDGQDVMVAGSGDGDVYGIQPRTGKILWSHALSRRGINTSAVIDDNGQVYASHGEENPRGTMMGAVVRIDAAAAGEGSQSAEVWRTEELTVGKSSPLLVGDRLCVVEDSSRLHVLDTSSGEEVGKPLKLGTAMKSSLLYADGKIYAATVSGIVHILRLTDAGMESVFKVRLPKGHDVGGSMIAAGGCVYLPTTGGLYCLADREDVAEVATTFGHAASSGKPKVLATSATAATITQLQLIPAEAIVKPGDPIAFAVKAFDATGDPVEVSSSDLRFETTGDATIGNSGNFVAGNDSPHAAATISVHLNDVTATARIRVIPPLPWQFDFTPGEVPVTWIGARYRHEARTVDGEPMIVKVTTIPKGTRSQTWFGPTDLHDYTVTTDVKAQTGTAKLPDMGVIAQRYTLDLMGESQQLQIRTWAAQLRMAKSVPVDWKAGIWYTLKFNASIENGIAVLKGKVWPRDKAEPTDWTVTATDEAANIVGSPGLFGNATNAEIFIDNVTVVSN